MVRHLVLFTLKDRSPENVEATARVLRGMEGKTEGMESLEVGVDTIHERRSCDIALVAVLRDWAAQVPSLNKGDVDS